MAEVVTGLVGGDLTTDVPEDINIAICVHVLYIPCSICFIAAYGRPFLSRELLP